MAEENEYTMGEATITNPAGIHARPSALIVKKCSESGYAGKAYVKVAGRKDDYCRADSIMGLMGMEAKPGDRVLLKIRGTGSEAKQFCRELSDFISADEERMPELFKKEMGIEWSTGHKDETRLLTKILKGVFNAFDFHKTG
jgi:phosphotransferase system HPr (HPr) family protein